MKHFTIELVPCRLPNTAVLRPMGAIDAVAAPTLELHFRNLFEQKTNRIVIDLSNTDFISSAGIGIFLGSVSLLRESGGDLLFMNIPKHIDEVFEVINLRSYFKTIVSVDELEHAGKR
jgi:anti-sigma B factor antagonist